jgi:hypothetical protein
VEAAAAVEAAALVEAAVVRRRRRVRQTPGNSSVEMTRM